MHPAHSFQQHRKSSRREAVWWVDAVYRSEVAGAALRAALSGANRASAGGNLVVVGWRLHASTIPMHHLAIKVLYESVEMPSEIAPFAAIRGCQCS